jgi:hypothetical protein
LKKFVRRKRDAFFNMDINELDANELNLCNLNLNSIESQPAQVPDQKVVNTNLSSSPRKAVLTRPVDKKPAKPSRPPPQPSSLLGSNPPPSLLENSDDRMFTVSDPIKFESPQSEMCSPQIEPPQKLIDVIKDPNMRRLFRTFCEDELAGENFAFWEAVEAYQLLEKPEQRKDMFAKIYHIFLSEESYTEMNISGIFFSFSSLHFFILFSFMQGKRESE